MEEKETVVTEEVTEVEGIGATDEEVVVDITDEGLAALEQEVQTTFNEDAIDVLVEDGEVENEEI